MKELDIDYLVLMILLKWHIIFVSMQYYMSTLVVK